MTEYNLRENEDKMNELNEKLNALKGYCALNNIPMFVACAVKNDDSGTDYTYDILMPNLLDLVLTDDKIPEFLKIKQGCVAVTNDIPLEMDWN